MSDGRNERARTVIAVLFFFSGAGSLVYQVVWVRMLVLVFGTSVFAVSTVLSAFMAGLALGGVVFGRLVDRRGNGLQLYAFLELLIGICALSLLPVFAGLDSVYTAAYRALEGHPYLFALFRFALSFGVLLVPTTLIGGTLPVLSRFAVRRLSRVSRSAGGLYAVNTFGAVAGTILVAFVLLEWLGVRGTVFVAAASNLVIALLAYLLARRTGNRDARTRDGAAIAEGAEGPAPRWPRRVLRAVFWGYAASGFVALGYEVVWSRLLSILLRSTTTQSLSTTLVVFLLGLALGGAVAARRADRWTHPLRVFAVAELLLGLYGLLSVAVFAEVPAIAEALGPVYSWWGHILRLVAVAAVAMLVPTFLMGMLFPVAGRLYVRSLDGVGRGIGGIWAANTAGAIVGAFATGFVLIPLLGSQGALQLLGWIQLAVGCVVLLLDAGTGARARTALLSAAVVAAIALAWIPPASHLVDRFRPRGTSDLLYHDEGAAGTVTVVGREDGSRLLRVNGAGEVPTDYASIQIFRLLGSLPLLLHPQPDEVLVIAFGGGITLSAVERQQPRHIDCVEVVPGVVEAAPYFSDFNDRVFERVEGGRIRLIADDGRNHVLRTDKSYDVILSDSTHPRTADSWVLYTRDFYNLCRRRLEDDGVMAQWVPLHGLTEDDYKMIVRTFRSVFPHATVWLNPRYSVLLGTPGPLRVDLERLGERLRSPRARAGLQEVNLSDPLSLLATLALDEAAAKEYAGSGRINTDDRAAIGFGDRRRSRTTGGLAVLIGLLPRLTVRAGEVVRAPPRALERVERRLRSRQRVLAGVVALRLGDRTRAATEMERAVALDPGNPEAVRQLRRIAGP